MRVPAHDARREQVWNLLLDEEWHTTAEISSAAVGGSEGTRRLRELRARCAVHLLPGCIEKRKALEGTQYEYRLARGGSARAFPRRTPV
jgi:hypothetical protein